MKFTYRFILISALLLGSLAAQTDSLDTSRFRQQGDVRLGFGFDLGFPLGDHKVGAIKDPFSMTGEEIVIKSQLGIGGGFHISYALSEALDLAYQFSFLYLLTEGASIFVENQASAQLLEARYYFVNKPKYLIYGGGKVGRHSLSIRYNQIGVVSESSKSFLFAPEIGLELRKVRGNDDARFFTNYYMYSGGSYLSVGFHYLFNVSEMIDKLTQK